MPSTVMVLDSNSGLQTPYYKVDGDEMVRNDGARYSIVANSLRHQGDFDGNLSGGPYRDVRVNPFDQNR
jgi:hypothetical protein